MESTYIFSGTRRFGATWSVDDVPGWVRLAVRLLKRRRSFEAGTRAQTGDIVAAALEEYLAREAPDLVAQAQRQYEALPPRHMRYATRREEEES